MDMQPVAYQLQDSDHICHIERMSRYILIQYLPSLSEMITPNKNGHYLHAYMHT